MISSWSRPPLFKASHAESVCLNCRRPVVHATYRATGGWEPDYDPSDDNATWRHLNGYAACMGDLWATPRPEVVVLCGSTRFPDAFADASKRLGLQGKIVLSVACFGHSGDLLPEQCEIGNPTKDMLDNLHKRKIDMADRVLVLNVGGYVGDSTRSEIAYAEAHEKTVEYLEPLAQFDGTNNA